MLSTIKKTLSYIFPITHKITSSYNGVLEITYLDGKKVLNTSNANYSFGSLHKIMQFALHKTALRGNQHILLLGLGGGSALQIIRKELLLNNPIDVVDIDPQIIKIAKQEFGLNDYSNVEVHCKNAFDFIQVIDKKYGLIIVDLFIDISYPKDLYEYFFWTQLINLSKNKCYIVFNTLSENNSVYKLNQIEDILKNENFEVFTYPEVEKSNTVIIAKRK